MTGNDPKSMKVVFVGRDNAFNRGIIRWLQEHYSLQAAFFIEVDRFTGRSRIDVLWKRGKKVGWFRLLNELAFRFYHSLRCSRKEVRMLGAYLPESFTSPLPVAVPNCTCEDIHDEDSLDQIRQLAPDIIFSVCTRTIFRRRLYSIPKYGTFMLHEGITPEYRGLHTAAWAILKREYQYLGYTLLKVNSGIDTGAILCQGRFPYQPEYGLCFGFVGHAALFSGLPEMKSALDKLHQQDGKFDPVPREGRISRNYSWVGLSDLLSSTRTKS